MLLNASIRILFTIFATDYILTIYYRNPGLFVNYLDAYDEDALQSDLRKFQLCILAMQIYPFTYELIQTFARGLKEYFREPSEYLDLASVVFVTLHVIYSRYLGPYHELPKLFLVITMCCNQVQLFFILKSFESLAPLVFMV